MQPRTNSKFLINIVSQIITIVKIISKKLVKSNVLCNLPDSIVNANCIHVVINKPTLGSVTVNIECITHSGWVWERERERYFSSNPSLINISFKNSWERTVIFIVFLGCEQEISFLNFVCVEIAQTIAHFERFWLIF